MIVTLYLEPATGSWHLLCPDGAWHQVRVRHDGVITFFGAPCIHCAGARVVVSDEHFDPTWARKDSGSGQRLITPAFAAHLLSAR